MTKEQIIEKLIDVAVGVGRDEYSTGDLWDALDDIADELRKIEPERFVDCEEDSDEKQT